MDPVAQFFVDNIVVVYFFYGLAFFVMGLIIWLESNRSSEFRITRVFVLLAGFGIIHGLHEWFEMFEKLSQTGAANIPSWLLIPEVRMAHLVVSFLLLIVFGYFMEVYFYDFLSLLTCQGSECVASLGTAFGI